MNLDMTKLSKSAGGTSGGSSGVREDTLGEFLNTVFSYQSKEDIPNQLQTQANVQNLKQISRDTTAIIARYGNLDYVLQIDALVGDSSIRGFIHGYLYNPNIKDVILVSINTTNGVATLKVNTDSGGTSETILQLDSIFMDVFNAYYGDETVDRIATSEEQTFFTNIISKLASGEKISGIYTSYTADMHAYLYLTFESYIEGAGIYFNLSPGDIDSGIKKVTLAYSEGGNILITSTIVSSGGLGQPIVLNYTQGNEVLTIPTALENGEYVGIITISDVYTLTINFYVDLNYNQFIGTTVSGKLSHIDFIIGAYIHRSAGWDMYANVLTLNDGTWGSGSLGALWELIKLSIGVYPTFTLYKKN